MHKLTIIQRFLNTAHDMQVNVLKFCYFPMVLVLLSCGNDVKTKQQEQTVTPTTSETTITKSNSKKTILCFGDSITAGYGLDDSNDAFPGILQTKIDSLGLDYVVVNSGLSGETSAGGSSRIKWVLNEEIDVFLLELGANDGLRGVPLSETRANLQAIIDAVRAKNPNTTIILAGMELPPNMGQVYTSEFRSLFADLAKKNDLKFIPFILENVGGIAELNQNDGIHPTIEGHKIVANNVWEVLETVIGVR
ncbi:arylesterase [Ulvibacter antarcticus]|uniref:Acyl-CoA thioesterase-1 n=1 Tax=Ulvibacter antarcticus TaxID=442714 RepID=A0A3L9YVH8_9FLAO|nr:arylesterase [Ulvibacter antarcticus]RMA64324.1 acyl-CoA thioesterase-1 [Ulvibacter antarcticus]